MASYIGRTPNSTLLSTAKRTLVRSAPTQINPHFVTCNYGCVRKISAQVQHGASPKTTNLSREIKPTSLVQHVLYEISSSTEVKQKADQI